MTRLIITRGIPGSGKSTWSNTWVISGPNRVRVNRDDIRRMCFGVDFGCDEQFVSHVETFIVESALQLEKSVVVDATHIKESYVNRWRRVAEDMDAEFVVKEFMVDYETAVYRNSLRERKVPVSVIKQMFDSLEKVGSLA